MRQHGVGRVVRGSAVPDALMLRGAVGEIAAGGVVQLALGGEPGRISGRAVSWGETNRRRIAVRLGDT